jgi:hypothetical protein
MGVGHYQFSKSESERKKQMDFFQDLKYEVLFVFCQSKPTRTDVNYLFLLFIQTLTTRISSHFAKKSRDQVLKERLRKVKQKRLLNEGYSLEEIEGSF